MILSDDQLQVLALALSKHTGRTFDLDAPDARIEVGFALLELRDADLLWALRTELEASGIVSNDLDEAHLPEARFALIPMPPEADDIAFDDDTPSRGMSASVSAALSRSFAGGRLSRVLIAEGHTLLRHGLRALITPLPDFEIVAEAQDGKAALHLALQLNPTLLLLDFTLPDMSGIALTAEIKRRLPDVRILLLSSNSTGQLVQECFRAGADGFVSKTASADELILAMRTVVAGRKYISADLAMHLTNETTDLAAKERGSLLDRLTTRERNVLHLIAEGHTNRSTAALLGISAKTVEKHRANLMRKLGLHNSLELVLVAVESGLTTQPSSGGTGTARRAKDLAAD